MPHVVMQAAVAAAAAEATEPTAAEPEPAAVIEEATAPAKKAVKGKVHPEVWQ